ncbi:MAG: zinc-binding dehydrogenase, partial [Dehalococcoidia bacterium]
IIPGCDVAGEVVSVAGEGGEVQPGQKVVISTGTTCGKCEHCLRGRDNLCLNYVGIGYHRDGGYAEYVAVPEANVFSMPESLSWEEAASVPLVFLTTWNMLINQAELQPGEDVLVLAAGSGVGIAAIQIAKLVGARVLATASTEEKLEKAKELGADEVINYSRSDFSRMVRRLTDRRGVDVVVEHTGAGTWHKSILSLARGGRLVTCGATSGHRALTDIRYIFNRELKIMGGYLGPKGSLPRILELVAAGRLRPVLDQIYPLTEAREAQSRLEDRSQFGKVVLRVE